MEIKGKKSLKTYGGVDLGNNGQNSDALGDHCNFFSVFLDVILK